ncbi:uncharacterized protein A1O9_07604 [Exophiala aquamarina CBS 119918]|uniref:Major facilitator superfamily (MFS) profile domain-containing protein n=1 Tax=Exophiala aquamarina CBS 119918 TaxID=1182545 RepID=A0A072P7C4_9EURO|nr:uncharacterized protein A1O9_07604 [Exophiala aquamarina CBS 119918]KEF56024.1 hypothetical protein A1O9_07604 [Exophiala aquamarina CBS 119918]
MDTQEALELRDQTNTLDRQQAAHEDVVAGHSLLPTDRGASAWLVLFGAFLLEGLVWGFVYSYGIFQEFYSRSQEFHSPDTRLPLVGTISSGLMFLCSPVLLPLLRQWPNRRKQCIGLGGLLTCAALIGASFAGNVTDLIIAQGVLSALGGSMVYYPTFLFLDEWFVRRKALAYGICWGASGFTGLVFPYIISWLLETHGFRTTLRVWSVVDLVFIAVALIILKPRLPAALNVHRYRPRLSFALKPLFLAFCIANVVQGLGVYLPGIYLPSYARSLGFSEVVATSSLSLINVGILLGSIVGGVLTDRWSPKGVIIVSALASMNGAALLWGFSASAALILLFGFTHGFFMGCMTASWPGVIREIVERDTTLTAEPSLIFALFVAGRGIGNVASGPLSQSLLHLPILSKALNYGYGSMYGSMILFSAGTMAAGVLGAVFDKMGVI